MAPGHHGSGAFSFYFATTATPLNLHELREDMPARLAERARDLSDRRPLSEGRFVLLWLHHAVRGHENPALDVAVWTGNRLGLPVLVYQGLSGRHRFNSDRHHTFIMEGARDVQKEVDARGIAYAFYLGQSPAERSPLQTLTRSAALVVTEDFPAPPFPRWTRALATRIESPVWAVDSHCIVPMRSLPEPFERAFELRRATATEFQRRVAEPWADVEVEGQPYDGDLGFEPVDLRSEDLAELCASCQIDHSIGPVVHTPGGSISGYARWQVFLENGLEDYARLRNDAAVRPPLGVSRMSAYLHHGHVSPFRIARHAHASPAAGAKKFLDELLIWRELAFNLCFFHEDVESLEALPDWAREALQRHTANPREAIFSWETLARGRTDSRLWDLAQRSLLRHGELHNNVRMTWGKALLGWTRNPDEALRTLIDLNHRFALDGNDPSSYGGLLWCLGLFDRPFKPERPVLGTVRPRPIEQHERRLDLDAYAVHVSRGVGEFEPSVAVVGAGISGLVSARTLVDQGLEVVVFDKGRSTGGRASTRRRDEWTFDHGAQYFTARDERFKRYVESWLQDGVVAPWGGQVGVVEDGTIALKSTSVTRYVGLPTMSAVARHLAADIDVRSGVRVKKAIRENDRWSLCAQSGDELGNFDCLVIATPPRQVVELLDGMSDVAKEAAQVQMEACRAVLVVFSRRLPITADGLFLNSGPLSWAARNSSKPGRPSVEAWVLHASPQWSNAHLEEDDSHVIDQLLRAFFTATKTRRADPVHAEAHRWRFAQAVYPLERGCLWDASASVAACGDWCNGSRIEGAFLSGMAAAGRALSLRRRR